MMLKVIRLFDSGIVELVHNPIKNQTEFKIR